mmetsp:Transcript_38267/g.57292  ORF Transcript_38267/g.57292 Transcript_38267/m.57292 type:complete len:928 (-) Transcript_38267:108-2891(-)
MSSSFSDSSTENEDNYIQTIGKGKQLVFLENNNDDNSSSIPPMPNVQIPQPTQTTKENVMYSTANPKNTTTTAPPTHIFPSHPNVEEEEDVTMSSTSFLQPRPNVPTPVAMPFTTTTPKSKMRNEAVMTTVKKQNTSSSQREPMQPPLHPIPNDARYHSNNTGSIFRSTASVSSHTPLNPPPSSSPQPQPPPPQPLTSHAPSSAQPQQLDFERRINNLATHLHQLNLIPSSSPPTTTQKIKSPQKDDSPLTHFLYTLRAMSHVVYQTPPTSPPYLKKCRALHSLLYMFENIIKEAVHLNQLADYWRQKVTAIQQENGAGKRAEEEEKQVRMERLKEMQGRIDWYKAELQTMQSHPPKDATKKDTSDSKDKQDDHTAKATAATTMQDHATDTNELHQWIQDENEQLKCMLQQMERKIELLGNNCVHPVTPAPSLPPSTIIHANEVESFQSTQQEEKGKLSEMESNMKKLQEENYELRQQLEHQQQQQQRDLETARKQVNVSSSGGSSTNGNDLHGNSNIPRNHSSADGPSNITQTLQQQQQQYLWNKEIQTREAELYQALSTREKELYQVQETLKHLQMQNNELHHLAQSKNALLERAEHDMHALTRENQAVCSESVRLNAELTATRNRLQDETTRADTADHTARACRLEKDDVMSNYRAVIEERTQLERSVEEVTRERTRLRHELDLSQDEVRRLRVQMDELENQIQKRVSDGAGFERQLDQVSRQGLATQRALDAAECENRRLREDLHAAKQSMDMSIGHTSKLRRSEAKLQEEANTMRGVLEAVESERDALRKILSEERVGYRGMENLLSSARARDAAAADQIRSLARENAEMATKLNEAYARLGSDAYCASRRMGFSSVSSQKEEKHKRSGVGKGNMDDIDGEQSGVAPVNISFSPLTQTEFMSVDGRKDSQPCLLDYLEKGTS